jgi:hypothetical protein
MVRYSVPVALLAIMLCVGLLGSVAAQEATPEAEERVSVLAPTEPAYGATPGEWYGRWWQWTASFPGTINPNLDATGELCSSGQHGPVFFLPRTFADTTLLTCTVPTGISVLVPIAGAECSTVEEPPFFGANEEELRRCAAEWTDSIGSVSMLVNGQEIMAMQTYRVSSPLFTLTFPPGNVYGVTPGVALSVADGYVVMLAPLPAGQHQIDVSATFQDGTLFQETTYILDVENPQVIAPVQPAEETPAVEATPVVATPTTQLV